jgi:hypothetical protein
MDCFLGSGNLGRLFKGPAKVLDFRNEVIKSIAYRSANGLRAGSHSSSTNQEDFENFSATDSLAVQLLCERKEAIEHAEAKTLQAAAEAQRKKDASDFLVPPPVVPDKKGD